MDNKETTEIKKEKVGLRTKSDFIKIGRKPAITYILATVTLFSQGAKKVTLQARGNSISTAVNVEQSVRRSIDNLADTIVKFDTVDIDDKEKNRRVKVSTADITLMLKE